MESSFCGCDQGPLAGLHLDTGHLKDVGQHFCEALSMMKDGGEEQWTLDKYVSWYRRIIDSLFSVRRVPIVGNGVHDDSRDIEEHDSG